jgi:hypothetical protein
MKKNQILTVIMITFLIGCAKKQSIKSDELLPKDAPIVSVPDESIKPNNDNYTLGKVVSEFGSPFYGSLKGYSEDLYLGRLSVGAKVLLMDKEISKNEFNIPIVKVKAIKDSDYGKANLGQIGWIALKDTNFINIYNPDTKMLEPTVDSKFEQTAEH